MIYLNYDLAKQITEDRRARAMAASHRRRAKTRRVVLPSDETAEVIELKFGTRCERERIGA